MTDNKQSAPTYEFLLKIIAVKMKIKFPCKMTLQFNKKTLTKEVPSAESNKFNFNQDIVIRGEDENSFQILAHLYTDKGTKYTSGVFKLLATELIRSQGQRIVLPLIKCLDPDAFCEIKVIQVINVSKTSSRLSRATSKVINSTQRPELLSPQMKKINSEKYLIGQTRSEINFGQIGGLFPPGSEQHRVRQTTKTQILKNFTKSPPSKFSNIKYVSMNSGNIVKNLSDFPVEQVGSQRPSFAQTEVYRQGYYKLKQKFKKQSQIAKEENHKRMLLQANQNNLKLQIMKLKLKTQQQQKQINEKNQKIKIINNQLIDLQKKDIDIVYLKQQNSNLARKLKISEQNTQIYHQDIESIKKLMGDRIKLSEQNLVAVKNELEFAKAKIQQQKYEFDSEIKAKDNIILGKNNDVKMRGDTIERQKKLIKQLEQQAEARMFDFQRSLTNERASLQLKIDQMKSKQSIIQKQKDEISRQNKQLSVLIQNQKNNIGLLEYRVKILSQDNIGLTQVIQQLKLIKQKYNQIQKQYKFLQQQFETVRKNLQIAVQNKEININQLVAKFQEGKQRQEKIKNQYDERVKSLLLKTQEMELIIETSKNSIQKNKRTIDAQNKENSSLRQQNNLLREQLKIVERRIINLEGEYSTNYNRYERQNANFKFLLEKYREEKTSLQKQNDLVKQKLQKSDQKLKEYQNQERQWKAKQRHFQQKIEKQSLKSKQSQTKYELTLRQNENVICQLNTVIESLQKETKRNVNKVNQYQLLSIKTKETHQFLKKDLKLSQEKISSLEGQLRMKNEEMYQVLQKSKLKQFKIHQNQHQISKLRQEIILYMNNSTKQSKMIELLNIELEKLKKNSIQLQNIIAQKQKNQERLRQEIKSSRDQFALQKIKNNKTQADFDKFKDSINDIINIEFTRLLNLPNSQSSTQRNTQRLRESQVSNAKSQKSRTKQSVDASQITHILAEKLHQTKNGLWKMAELNKVLRIQNQKLLQQSQTQTNRHQFDKLQLHRDIQLLQDEMNNIISDKEVENINYDNMLIELNNRLKEKDMLIEQMKQQNQELSAINTGMKTDFETNNQLNDKKVNTLKANINELNQKIEYLNFNLGCLEDKNHELEQKTIQQQNQIINHKQMLIKYEKTVQDTKQNDERLIKQLQILKKQYKLLNEKYTQLQILINSQKQTNQKYMKMIQEQQKKVQKLNQFIKSLILQKQTAIKNQLQKSQQANTLQTKNFELTHQNEVLQDQNQLNRKKIEELKEQIKNLSKSLKQTEKNLTQEKSRHARGQQKIKERQNDLEIKKEYIKDLQNRYRELRDKNYKEIKQLSNQLQDKSAASLSQHKQLNQQILKLQSQSKRVWEENFVLKNELQNITKQIYKKNDQIEDLQSEIKIMKEQKLNLQDQLASKQFLIHQKADEVQKFEQLLEYQRINMNNLNNQYQVQEKQFNLNITQITNQYNFKIETTSKEYQQKLQLQKRQLDFIKQKLKNVQEQLTKIQLQKKSQEIDFEQSKKNYEQKIKKIESERLTTTLSKNNQIKKISLESKNHLERLKLKQAELRKINLELQQLKLTSGRSQQFNTHSIQQGKTKEKLLQKQIENYKKKQEVNNTYKMKLLESLYKNEGDVRKIIANTMKKLTQICNKSDSQKILGVVKGLQSGVVSAMMANFQAR